VAALEAGERGVVLLDKTAFYAESGGQVGDQGLLLAPGVEFWVEDTRKQGKHFLHYGELRKGHLASGLSLQGAVTSDRRHATMLNHSATHLMHAALRKVLGEHVGQKGSLVNADYLRFDFSHNKAMTAEEIEAVEILVNGQVLENNEVQQVTLPIEQARAMGALALFGEKYGDVVRVISMGNNQIESKSKVFSIELCGGTHVRRTGDIGLFRIVQEGGIAAGVRRIEAVTGFKALELVRKREAQLGNITLALKASADNVLEKVQQLLVTNKAQEKELQQLKGKLALASGDELLAKATQLQGGKVLVSEVQGLDSKALRDSAEQLRNKLGSGVVVLALNEGDRVSIVAAVSKDLVGRVKAGELVNKIAAYVGGKGGGRPDMAMAGGTNPEGLSAALAAANREITALLSLN
jgi:alanyl-tRNA synthetase